MTAQLETRVFTCGHHIAPNMLDAGKHAIYKIRVKNWDEDRWFTVGSGITGLVEAIRQMLSWWQTDETQRVQVWEQDKEFGKPWGGATLELEKHRASVWVSK